MGGKTVFYTLLLALGIVMVCENLLNSPRVQTALPYPSWGVDYYSFEEQYARLELFAKEHNGVDCVFLGSSMVLNGISPSAFEAAYHRHNNDSLECFNFGVTVLTASAGGAVAQILDRRFHLKVLIWGTAVRDYTDGNAWENEDEFPQSAWARYKLGSFSFEGWLIDHSAIYRYLLAMPDIVFIKDYRQPEQRESRFEDGFQAATHYDRFSPLLWNFFGLYTAETIAPYRFWFSSADWHGFEQIVGLADADTQVFVVEMPTYPGALPYLDASDQTITLPEVIGDYTYTHGVPFWSAATQPALDDADWVNRMHFEYSGAWKFSTWLGEQVGAAVSQGVTPAMLQEPPLPDLTFEDSPDVARDGLGVRNEAEYQHYLQGFDMIPRDVTVFDPSKNLYNLDVARLSLGFFIERGHILDRSRREDFFGLRAVLEQVKFESDLTLTPEQQQALNVWRATKSGADLRAAGVDYLLFNTFWYGYLTKEEAVILNDPQQYRLIKFWKPVPLGESYWLYKVEGN